MKFVVSQNQDEISLYYGLDRNSVRKFFNCSVQELKNSEFSKNTTDDFNEINIHCFYDENNKLSEIEIFRPNKFCIELNSNFNWMNRKNNEILEFLEKNNFHGDIEIEDGLLVDSYAIATVIDGKGLTECCYVDLAKISYLNCYK